MKKYEYLFNGNIGTWRDKPYDIKLKPYAEPYHGRPDDMSSKQVCTEVPVNVQTVSK